MVASTPKKSLFEGNAPLNTQPLFFEFAFESTPVNFTPQPNLVSSLPLVTAKRKKIFLNATRLGLGLLITALLISSGIFNSELFFGGSGTNASLGWIPSWSEDTAPNPDKTKTATVLLGTTEISKAIANQEEDFASLENITAFAPSEETKPIADLNTPNLDGEIEPVTKAKEAKAPAAKTAKITTKKPIIKQPVFRLSKPVVNPATVVSKSNKLEVTSEAFHAVNAKSALDGKKIFIKFGARWCLPCKMMEKNVFPDPVIRQTLRENYHVLDVDVDNLDGINLRQIYNVEALPSFIILDSQQNIVGRHEGAKRIEELRSILGSKNP